MGLFDRLSRSADGSGEDDTDSDEEDDPSEWSGFQVCYSHETGGWSPVGEFKQMDEPVDPDMFRWNCEKLKPGKYRLFAEKNGMRRAADDHPGFDVEGWTIDVEPEDATAGAPGGADEAVETLRSELRSLRSELKASDDDAGAVTTSDPEMLDKQLEVSMKQAALTNEEFMRKHGDTVMLSMFDSTGGKGGPGYDEYQESPMGAALYETFDAMMNEPEKVQRMGEAVGSGFGKFVSGMGSGMNGDGDIAVSDSADPPASSADDGTPEEVRDVDSGRSSFDDLGVEEPDPDEVEEIAAAQVHAERSDEETPPAIEEEPEAEPQGEPEPEPDDDADDLAEPSEDDLEIVDRGENGAGMSAGPSAGTKADDTSQEGTGGADTCQSTTSDGEPCKNPVQPGSDYCHVESHGPNQDTDPADDLGLDPDAGSDPDPAELAEELS